MNKSVLNKILVLAVFMISTLCANATVSTKEFAIEQLRQNFAENPIRFDDFRADISLDSCKLLLRSDGRFIDIAEEQSKIESTILKRTEYNVQPQVSSFLEKAFRRLWVISESYRGKDLKETDYLQIKDQFWKAVENYSTMELARPNVGPGRFHVSCFFLPTAVANIYYSFLPLIDSNDKNVNTIPEKTLSAMHKVALQAWTQPYRDDETDKDPFTVERFRKHVWWVGGNALDYRPLLAVACMERSVKMIDVVNQVSLNSLSSVSQNTYDQAFWIEGMTADGAGWGHGKQCLVWGYPIDGAIGALRNLTLLKSTSWGESFNSTQCSVLMNYFQGASWYYYKGYIPPCFDRYSMKYVESQELIRYNFLLKLIIDNFISQFSIKQQKELKQLSEELKTYNVIMESNDTPDIYQGTRWFFNNDDLIKKNKNYYTLINMASSRCDGLESAYTIADGFNLYACDGLTIFEKSGNEYHRALGAMQLTAMPGVTAKICDETLVPITNWGGYNSLVNFAAGATRGGEHAVAGFIFEKTNTEQKKSNFKKEPNPSILGIRANKSYFMVRDFLVCLGAGIKNTTDGNKFEICTSIDQTTRQADVVIGNKKRKETYTPEQNFKKTLKTSAASPTWVMQKGGFAYTIISPYTSEFEVEGEKRKTDWERLNEMNKSIKTTSEANILQLTINHGIQPKNDTYGYAVYCGENSFEQLIQQKLPFEVLANNEKIQAIQTADGKIIQAIFYDAQTSLRIGKKSISVSSPCALQIEIENDQYHVTVTDALMDKNLREIVVTNSVLPYSVIPISMPQGELCGKPATVTLVGKSQIYKEYVKNPVESRLPDFSYAGYHYGKKEIPNLPVTINVIDADIRPDTGEDLTVPLQNLIDSVGKSGGGVIFFPRGKYCINMDTTRVQFLAIDYSNIVLRGESSAKDGTIIFNGAINLNEKVNPWLSPFAIRFGHAIQGTERFWGVEPLKPVVEDVRKDGTDDRIYKAPILCNITENALKGATKIKVNNSAKLKAGDVVLLAMYNTDGTLLQNQLGYKEGDITPDLGSARRSSQEQTATFQWLVEIADVKDNIITLKQPLRCDISMSYLPALAEAPMIREVGVEHLRIETAWDGIYLHHGGGKYSPRVSRIMDYGWNAINFCRVAHGWLQDVVISDCTNPIYLQDSRNVTVRNVTLEGAMGHCGIKLYAHATDNLVKDIYFTANYTHMLSGEGNVYGNVFTNVEAYLPGQQAGDFDFHGFSHNTYSPPAWNLFERVKGLGLISGGGAPENFPHTAMNNVWWNIQSVELDKPKELFYHWIWAMKRYNRYPCTDHHLMYPGSIVEGFVVDGKVPVLIDGTDADRNDKMIVTEKLNKGWVYPVSLYESQYLKK